MAAQTESALTGMLPARYAKFAAVLIGAFITYVSIYGWVWHLDPALLLIGTSLGVYGVPNGKPPVTVVPVPVPVIESTTVIEDVPPEPPAKPPPGYDPAVPPHA